MQIIYGPWIFNVSMVFAAPEGLGMRQENGSALANGVSVVCSCFSVLAAALSQLSTAPVFVSQAHRVHTSPLFCKEDGFLQRELLL